MRNEYEIYHGSTNKKSLFAKNITILSSLSSKSKLTVVVVVHMQFFAMKTDSYILDSVESYSSLPTSTCIPIH